MRSLKHEKNWGDIVFDNNAHLRQDGDLTPEISMLPHSFRPCSQRIAQARWLLLCLALAGTSVATAAQPTDTQPAQAQDGAARSAGSPADPARTVAVLDQDLRAFLLEAGARAGLRTEVAQGVKGRLTRMRLPADPVLMLRELERRYEIEWSLEGEFLRVEPRSETVTRILPLGSATYAALLHAMRAVDLDPSRYAVKLIPDANAVMVTAPTAYLGKMTGVLDTLRGAQSFNGDLRIIRFGVPHRVDLD